MLSYIQALKNVIIKPLRVRQLPIHIQVEHTTYCNLNCKSCERSKYIQDPRHLRPDDFKKILEQTDPKKISLSGLGESFMSPHTLEIISLAKAQGCSINTTTNGILLAPGLCEGIVKSGLDLIKISIDGATRETYQQVRGEDKFLQIVDGIRALSDAKKRLDSRTPFIRLNYVMLKDNYHEIADVVELADKLGVDAIYFQPLELVGIEERSSLLVGNLTYEVFSQEILRALDVARTRQVKTNLEIIYKKLPIYWKKYRLETYQQDQRICIVPWFSSYITVDGMVRPCCSFSQSHANMGNIWEHDMREIWNNEKYQRFRKAIRAGKRPYPICENCVPQNLSDIIRSSRILPGFLK